MPEEHQDNGSTLPVSAKAKNGKLNQGVTEVDFSEADPCLTEDNKPKPKQLSFFETSITSIQDKTGLSRKWVFVVLGLAVIALSLFLVVVGLSVGWPVVPHMFQYPICREPQCLRAASQVQENLNTSISPCTNLWGAVCSQYTTNSIRPLDRPVWNQKEFLLQQEHEKIRDVISTFELPLHIGTAEWKMNYFYEACLNLKSIGLMDDTRPLRNIIAELGGWYIFGDWSLEEFNGDEVLKKLHVKYGVSPFFKVHVAADPREPNRHSIRISPSGLGLPDKNYYRRDNDDPVLIAYEDFIRDVVISLSLTGSDATKFGRDMFNYEKRLAEITPDLSSLRNPITTYNVVPLEELKLTTNTIPFYDILQAMYPDVNISENTDVIVTSPEYLSQVSQIISSTDRTTLNSYLIWCLVREYLPFLSDRFTSALDSFNNKLFGTSKSKKRWEVCTGLVKQHMSLATEYHLEEKYPISDGTRQRLNDTFVMISNVIKGKLSKFDDTVLLMQHLEAKMNTLSLHIGLPESTKSPHFLKDYYNSLRIMKLDLFEGMESAMVFHRKVEEKMLLNTLPEGVFLAELANEVPKVRYLPSRNAIVVPRSLVMEPFFDSDYPRPVLYGRLGVEIATAILTAIFPYGSLWSSNRKILSPMHMTVNESIKSVQSNVDCLAKCILKLNASTTRISDTALTVLTQLSAIEIAHEALLEVSNLDGHKHYGGLEQYEESALYFLSFAQTQCSVATKEYETYRNLLYFELPSKSVLTLAWMQLDHFRKALDCPAPNSASCSVF